MARTGEPWSLLGLALLLPWHCACHGQRGPTSTAFTQSLLLWRCSVNTQIQIVLHEKQLKKKKKGEQTFASLWYGARPTFVSP